MVELADSNGDGRNEVLFGRSAGAHANETLAPRNDVKIGYKTGAEDQELSADVPGEQLVFIGKVSGPAKDRDAVITDGTAWSSLGTAVRATTIAVAKTPTGCRKGRVHGEDHASIPHTPQRTTVAVDAGCYPVCFLPRGRQSRAARRSIRDGQDPVGY